MCFFLQPPLKRSSVLVLCLMWGAFPLDFGFLCLLWEQYKKASQKPNTAFHWVPVTHHSHEQKSVVSTWSVENLPVSPQSVISEESLLDVILISSEWVQVDSNTRNIVLWAISLESCRGKQSKVTFAHVKCQQAKTYVFYFLCQGEWERPLQIFLNPWLKSRIPQNQPWSI